MAVVCLLSGCSLYFGGDDRREVAVDAGGSRASPDAHGVYYPDAANPVTACDAGGAGGVSDGTHDVAITWNPDLCGTSELYFAPRADEFTYYSHSLFDYLTYPSYDETAWQGPVDCTLGMFVLSDVPLATQSVISRKSSHSYTPVYAGSWYVPQFHAISNGSVWIDIVNGVDCRCVDDYLGGYCYSPSGW
jgi:hypothetical protein